MESDGAPPIHGHSTDPGLMQVDVEEDMPRKSIKRPCDDDLCDECEFVVEPSRKRFKTASDAICLPSQSLAVQFNGLHNRVVKLEAENACLKDELDRVHCISRLRYHQMQHLENVVQKLCKTSGIDYCGEDYSDPEYFSPFRVLPTEVLSSIIDLVDHDGRKRLKEVCVWWNRVTKERMTSLRVRCSWGMRGLMGYPRLNELEIASSLVGNHDYQNGKYMQHLNTLVLHGVTIVPFNILAQLPYLKTLEIDTSDMPSMEGLELLKHVENLTLASIIATFAFPVSACHPKLKRLVVKDCVCVRIQTIFLGCCKNLEYIQIDSALQTPITSLDFVKSTPHLRHFSLNSCCGEEVSSFPLDPLTSLKNLEYLSLRGYPDLNYCPLIGLETIRHFAPGTCCDVTLSCALTESKFSKHLESLELVEIEEVTDELLAVLPQCCPELRRLVIIDCQAITSDCITSLKQLPKLRCLQLSPECWWSTFENIDSFRSLCATVQLDDV